MLQGITMQSLAQRVQNISDSQKDFIADDRSLIVKPAEMVLIPGSEEASGYTPETLSFEGGEDYILTDHAHRQLAARFKIPVKYYWQCREAESALITDHVNYWLQQSKSRRLIRTYDNKARAYLSDRYRILDNYSLLKSILPKFQQRGVEIKTCNLSETKLYIKVIFPELSAEITGKGNNVGDTVQAGLVFQNSEVGAGAFRIQPMIWRLVCANGMICQDHGIGKYHIGRILGDGDSKGVERFFTPETIVKDNEAFFAKVNDTVDALLTKEVFDEIVGNINEAASTMISQPAEVIDVTAKRHGLFDEEKDDVLEHFIKGGDLSTWGLTNAITRTAHDLDYERGTELENIAWQVLISGQDASAN